MLNGKAEDRRNASWKACCDKCPEDRVQKRPYAMFWACSPSNSKSLGSFLLKMSLQEPPIAAFGLDEASISDSGELELNNLEDLHQIFPEVALVLGDHTDKGFGKLAITNR